MEDLQSLMTCLDDISSKIPDGIYLDMADKIKRVHDHMNGNKPFHEDTFYYSDDDSELDSDDDSDSDYEVRSPVNAGEAHREVGNEIRRHLLDCVRSMHHTWIELEKWNNEVKKEWARARPLITRMTATRKEWAIQRWCEKNTSWALSGELVGHGGWTWENLVENGLRTIVLEIGTEEEKVPDFVYYDDLSLKTLQKLPAFEKKIYDDYKEECQRKWYVALQNAKLKVVESKAKMTGLETACVEREYLLGVGRGSRPFWNSATNDFCANGGHP